MYRNAMNIQVPWQNLWQEAAETMCSASFWRSNYGPTIGLSDSYFKMKMSLILFIIYYFFIILFFAIRERPFFKTIFSGIPCINLPRAWSITETRFHLCRLIIVLYVFMIFVAVERVFIVCGTNGHRLLTFIDILTRDTEAERLRDRT